MSNSGKPSTLLATATPGTVNLGAVAEVIDQGIVSRTLLSTPELRVVWFGFAAGQGLSEHTNTARALVQILEGECEFSANGVAQLLRAGDVLHLPPNAPHAVRTTGPMKMLLVLAPERKGA